MPSDTLKARFTSKGRYKLIQKLQSAVAYAKELGANTVGLGQFTSIVSGNGLYLDPMGMNLTTGNAYTTVLSVEAALKALAMKTDRPQKCKAALIGAAGNIMSSVASLLAEEVGSLLLIHHSPIEASTKFQESLRRLVKDWLKLEAKSPLLKALHQVANDYLWNETAGLMSMLKDARLLPYLETCHDMTRISEAELVICGASSQSSFLTLDMFKLNTVIVDLAVPAGLSDKDRDSLTEKRPDLIYLLGGIARFPLEQWFETPILPLEKGESFACMAETFALALSGEKNQFQIGDLNREMLDKSREWAKKAGFDLARLKTSRSF